MEPELTDEFKRRVYEQLFEMWINPEIDRRRVAGRLPDDFALYAAQVIMNPEATGNEVRLNDEVAAIAMVRARGPLEPGEPVSSEQVEQILGLELTERDPNAGHMTLLYHANGWHLSFSFRYNTARITESIEAARQFLNCARFALSEGYLRVFVENLFAAVELLAKSEFLALADRDIMSTKKHSAIRAKYNRWGGRVDGFDHRFAALLNRLGELREPARYLRRPLTLTTDGGADMLALADEMFGAVTARSPRRMHDREVVEGGQA